MIKSIYASRGITVTGSQSPFVPRVYSNNSYMSGHVMYDLDSQSLKVFDGASWQSLDTGMVNIELDSDTQTLLDWARRKRDEEYRRIALAKDNPALKDILKQIQEKEEQFEIVYSLTKKEDKVGTN